jgi:hypothetical protein
VSLYRNVEEDRADASGVAGALLQVSLQIGTSAGSPIITNADCLRSGSVIGLSVQAGLYSRVNNDLSDWRGTQYGYYFNVAWLAVSLLAFIIFYRPEASRKVLSELEQKEKEHGDRVGAGVSVA